MTEMINVPFENNFKVEEKKPRRKTPLGVNSACKQHVIACIDTSGSMAGENIKDVNDSVQEVLINDLAQSQNKNGYFLSIVSFNTNADLIHSGIAAADLNNLFKPLDAVGGTNFNCAIQHCIEAVNQFNQVRDQGYKYLRPVCFFLSDGHSNVSDELLVDLKEISDIVSVAYGSDADEAVLKQIASTDEHFFRVNAGKAHFRTFLAAVTKTLESSLERGEDATYAISDIKKD